MRLMVVTADTSHPDRSSLKVYFVMTSPVPWPQYVLIRFDMSVTPDT
eukprot:CAMPEP_0171635618 /NCGR_PEP_ID=MMETSP0990-20121206/26805_1 /TAXON_ID=483369 /ORGANISM="non described non described, Strain CCMP2098" /LENGTH=46 /DNA_ID= /DNA_START= /DNA_END= /DNA_ORIENTATION=